MDLRQEIEIWYLIPAIRKNLAFYLKEEGIKQKEIAQLLNLTPSAISQYIKKKRSKEDLLSLDMISKIKESTNRIIKKLNFTDLIKAKQVVIAEFHFLCEYAYKQKLTCEIHKKKNSNFKNCNVCFNNCN
ncbi:helix-turn-helix domain-containing protein [Candidatus Woesearchaeota archaeon]|nr:helix-turn-helix domain-containing protein [Candidatus Woesearchaeota archaeon]